MISKIELNEAIEYNSREGRHIDQELPFPWSDAVVSEFEAWTSLFQAENGLKVDGKLGPKTIGMIMDKNKKYSNNVVIGGELVGIPDELIKIGCVATNYLQDGEVKFKSNSQVRLKIKSMKYVVIHETCGNTADGCKATLDKKRYGVHLILGPGGELSCHADLKLDRVIHGNQLNQYSCGIEVVNPYSPLYIKDENIWNNIIDRKWWTWVPGDEFVRKLLKKKNLKSAPKKYVCPTDKQIEVLKILVPWLCEKLCVPYTFPTVKRRAKVRWPNPGVVPHRSFSKHSDGQYIVEYLNSEGLKCKSMLKNLENS